MTIAVTGATGGVGGRVARRLADRGVSQVLVVRDESRAPELPGASVRVASGYEASDEMRLALEGVDVMFLIPAHESRDRVSVHRGAVEAAVDAGVRRIVYLSFLDARPDSTFTFGRDHFHTEELVRSSGVPEFTFLRMSMYADFIPLMADENGVIRGPADGGRVSVVARDDIADAAAVVLTSEGHAGASYDMTGPEALTMAEMAEEISRATGRRVVFQDETLEEAYASRAGLGEDWEVEGWVTSYVGISTGEWSQVSGDIRRLTGHDPTSFAEYLRKSHSSRAG